MLGFDSHTGQQAPQCLRSGGQGEKPEEVVVYFPESTPDQEGSEYVCTCIYVCVCRHVYLCVYVTLEYATSSLVSIILV